MILFVLVFALNFAFTWVQFPLLAFVLVSLKPVFGVREVISSIPVGDSDFFLVPRSCHVDKFTFDTRTHCRDLPNS